MPAIASRLDRLAAKLGGDEPCPACGHPPGDLRPDAQFKFAEPDEPRPPDFCPTCGRQLVVRLKWPNPPLDSDVAV